MSGVVYHEQFSLLMTLKGDLRILDGRIRESTLAIEYNSTKNISPTENIMYSY